MNSSGSAAFDKDDGSTEPEKKHRIDTVHHQTGKIIRKAHLPFIVKEILFIMFKNIKLSLFIKFKCT